MSNLFNAVAIFGNNHEGWSSAGAIVLIVFAQMLILAGAVLLVDYLIKHRPEKSAREDTLASQAQPTEQQDSEPTYAEETAEPVRELTGVTLDPSIVSREFNAGDEFNCDGLVVRAEYSMEPTYENIVDYTVVDYDTYVRLEKKKKLNGVYVIKPQMDKAGIKVVTVRYEGQSTVYTISVNEQEEPTPEPIVEESTPVAEEIAEENTAFEQQEQPATAELPIVDEESVEAGILRYDKSFLARLIQSEDDIKNWYTDIKNVLLSYKTCKGRISWKRETFKANKQVVAMLVFRGKKLCLFLPLNPADYADEKCVEDASDIPTYAETPAMIRLTNDKRIRIAKQLITESMKRKGAEINPNYVSADFYLPYEGIVELINKDLVKREIRTSADEAIFDQSKQKDAE